MKKIVVIISIMLASACSLVTAAVSNAWNTVGTVKEYLHTPSEMMLTFTCSSSADQFIICKTDYPALTNEQYNQFLATVMAAAANGNTLKVYVDGTGLWGRYKVSSIGICQ